MVRSFTREGRPHSPIILQTGLTNGELFTQPPSVIAFDFYEVLKQNSLKAGVFLLRHHHRAILN